MPAGQCFFQMAQAGQSVENLLGMKGALDADALGQISKLNGFTNTQMSKGQVVFFDPGSRLNEEGVGYSKQIADQVNYAMRNRAYDVDPASFNRDFDILNIMSSNKNELSITSKILSVGSKVAGENFKEIQANFEKFNRLYIEALRTTGKLRTPQFQAAVKPVAQQLQQSLKGLSGTLILPKPDRIGDSLKKGLDISHKSLEKSFRLNGGDSSIKPLSDAIEKSAKLSALAKRAGNVAKVLSIGNSVTAAANDFKNKGSAQGFHTMGREAAGFVGSAQGGALGVSAGVTAAVLVLGTATGGLGFFVVGIGALAGGYIGKELCQGAYDGAGIALNQATESAIDWWFE